MERDLIMDRTRAGLAASRARGRVGGRPKSMDETKIKAAKAMLASGDMTVAEIAKQIGCSTSSLYRHVTNGRSGIQAAA